MKEIWKDIEGYKGFYQINNLGIVISIKNSKHKIMKPYKLNNGYLQITLYNKCRKSFLVHRLVAIAFIPNPENKKEVNHKFGNKLDNRVENLEWCTRGENKKHAVKFNLTAKGEKHGRSKLTMFQVKEIRNKFGHGLKQHELAKIYNVSKGQISKIIYHKSW